MIFSKGVASASSSSESFTLICGVAICKEQRLLCQKTLMCSQSQLSSTLPLISTEWTMRDAVVLICIRRITNLSPLMAP